MSCSKQKLMFQPYPGASGVFVRWHVPNRDDLDLKALDAKAAPGVRHYLAPCGQCIQCRLQKSRETATRILLETKTSKDVWGVTLTYDPEHLPQGRPICDDDGVVLGTRPTLVPEHCQKFQKDLRRYFDYHFGLKNIRFYLGAEYGSINARPHYHYIFFNLPLPVDDVTLLPEKTQTGEDMFDSKIISSIWKKGFVRLNAVSWQYAAYVARYIMKKQLGKGSSVYDELGIISEFTRCSTKPGLGYDYFKAHEGKLLEEDKVLIKRALEVERVPLPKYFLRKAEEEGIDISSIKERRRDQAIANALKIQASISEDYFDWAEKQDVFAKGKNKALTRGDF